MSKHQSNQSIKWDIEWSMHRMLITTENDIATNNMQYNLGCSSVSNVNRISLPKIMCPQTIPWKKCNYIPKLLIFGENLRWNVLFRGIGIYLIKHLGCSLYSPYFVDPLRNVKKQQEWRLKGVVAAIAPAFWTLGCSKRWRPVAPHGEVAIWNTETGTPRLWQTMTW